jgi:hypothetical protein
MSIAQGVAEVDEVVWECRRMRIFLETLSMRKLEEEEEEGAAKRKEGKGKASPSSVE